MSVPAQTKTRRRLALLFSVPLAFSLLFFIANQWAQRIDLGFLKVQNLSSNIKELLLLSKDVESAERGFLLTGDERYLLPLSRAKAWMPSQVDLLRSYARDGAEYRMEVEQLISLIEQRIAEADEVVQMQENSNFVGASNLIRSGRSQETSDRIRRAANDVIKHLDTAQIRFLDRQNTLNHLAFFLFLGGTAIMMVVLIWLYNAVISYIDDRDAAQAQLQALNKDLEERINERTRELQASNEELQQFAYVASHDLQEPLRTISSFTQLLSERYQGKLDEDADEFIAFIVSSSKRMTDLINGLLALVRLRKSGQPTLPVPFESLLADAESSLQASIRENGARIEHGPLPALAVDKVQLTQVLQNLISNAIKYRREEPPAIHVSAEPDRSHWIFCVSDNGQGFEPQYAERIFGIFQRLHGREVEGTGMGLAITRKIVERHGGRIWAESTPGAGSRFFFSLPASLETSRASTPLPESMATGKR